MTVAHGVKSEIDAFQNNSLTPTYQWPDGTVDNGPISPQIASAPQVQVFTVADPQHASNVAIAHGNTLAADYERRRRAIGENCIGRCPRGSLDQQGRHCTGRHRDLSGRLSGGEAYPFLVLPHGGPEANDSLRLDMFSRTFAGMGYVVLQPEYRGSTGYGTDFLNAIYQHFGDRAYRDVDSATDYAIAQGWADPNRLTIFGWSAGGFMTSWTVTQTHRYKAAIEGAGITDWLSFMWTSDVQQIDYDARWPDKDPDAFLDVFRRHAFGERDHTAAHPAWRGRRTRPNLSGARVL